MVRVLDFGAEGHRLPAQLISDLVHHKFNMIRNFKPLAMFCGCIARFVSGLVGNPEDRFSYNGAYTETWTFGYRPYMQHTV